MLDRVSPDYLKMQNEVTNNHRTILVDWMCDVGIKFKLLTETMFLAVYIMDKYLSLKEVPRSKFQLLGTTSILIASKFEEIYTPEVKDFVWVSGQAYNAEEFLKMERTILSTLDFNVSTPIPLHFLRRFSKAAKSDAKLHKISKSKRFVYPGSYGPPDEDVGQVISTSIFIRKEKTTSCFC